MCGRYTLAASNPAEVRARFGLSETVAVRRRFNVAPGDDVLAITTDREGRSRSEELRWGLVPTWANSPANGLKMINARVETVRERPAYRRAFERFRCLILADGFYEWQRLDGPGRVRKQPFWIHRADGAPFAFAGLWSIWHGPQEETLRSCTIITAPANPVVAPLHDRMPAILAPGTESHWLDAAAPPEELLDLLHGLPSSEIALQAVSSAVNDARYDGPECLAPPAPEPQAALF
ncbi:MAG TPA: SOS response-associated peptidase [Solirubrobacteraceae bacterium]|nr:SOS response-associated peptidase [Solirubrobacteraceae bacterium]